MMNNLNYVKLLISLLCIGLLSYVIYGDPTTPGSIINHGSSQLNTSAYGSTILNVTAGNITKLMITSTSQTQIWAGLYGNVSGTITLDDAQNFTFFSWPTAEPRGVIYAVNQSISDWSTLHCFNFTNRNASNNMSNISQYYFYDGATKSTNTTNFLTGEELDNLFSIAHGDSDGVNNTFNQSNTHDGFYAGSTEILTNDCPALNTNQNDAAQSENFQEVLLTVNNSELVVFASLLENRIVGNETDRIGFNGKTWDFQLMVLENGKAGNEAPSPYYIYVELS